MKIKNYVDVYVKGINLTILTRLTVSVLLIHVVRRKNNCRQLSEKKEDNEPRVLVDCLLSKNVFITIICSFGKFKLPTFKTSYNK